MSRTYTRRLLLERAERVADGAGGFELVWARIGALWGDVRMRSGDLRATEFGDTPRRALRIVTHAMAEDHPTRPWPGDRLRDGTRSYAVSAVHDDDVTTILAREIVSEDAA